MNVVNQRCPWDHCKDDDTYRMEGGCYNCGEPAVGIFTKSHDARGGDCPVCGCHRMHWDRLEKERGST